ncbi:hypothetical protein EDC01DRAFT_781962 [Geopyxis carbonaria]|nr:hypothetical protein EDC01DRAFT_781962 [Geopyxis carbonaria]
MVFGIKPKRKPMPIIRDGPELGEIFAHLPPSINDPVLPKSPVRTPDSTQSFGLGNPMTVGAFGLPPLNVPHHALHAPVPPPVPAPAPRTSVRWLDQRLNNMTGPQRIWSLIIAGATLIALFVITVVFGIRGI